MAGDTHAIFADEYFEGARKLYKVAYREIIEFPEDLSDIAVEAIDALRSALDQACYAVSLPPRKNAYFPIADDAAGLENVIKGRCRDLPVAIQDLLRGYKVYPGGTELIWAFNKVRQGNQHKILSAVGAATSTFEIAANWDAHGGIVAPAWNYDKREIIIAIVDDPAKVDLKLKFFFYIKFVNAGPLDRHEALPHLRVFAAMVERIINDIEAAAQNLR